MSQPVNHRGCDLNRRQVTTAAYSLSFVPRSSASSICFFASSVWPAVSSLPSSIPSSSSSTVELGDARVMGLRVLIPWHHVLLSRQHSHHSPLSQSLSLARRCVRVRVSGILGASERGRQEGSGKQKGDGGFGGVRSEVRKWAPRFICFCLSFISSYYY